MYVQVLHYSNTVLVVQYSEYCTSTCTVISWIRIIDGLIRIHLTKKQHKKDLLRGHEPFVCFLEPFNGLILCDPVVLANPGPLFLALAHSSARAKQHDEKVHAINASGRIVLDPKIDVLVNSKPEATF